MLEAFLVVVVLSLLAGGTLVVQLVPAEWVVQASWACAAIGLLVGIPTGFWYHVKLRACLQRAGVLPERWWLRPVAHHERLSARERPGVMFWFTVGGAGFGLTVLGCVGVAAGVLLQAWRAGVL